MDSVTVSQANIDSGVPHEPRQCAVALALKEHTGVSGWFVGTLIFNKSLPAVPGSLSDSRYPFYAVKTPARVWGWARFFDYWATRGEKERLPTIQFNMPYLSQCLSSAEAERMQSVRAHTTTPDTTASAHTAAGTGEVSNG